jgi:hypothetical protein
MRLPAFLIVLLILTIASGGYAGDLKNEILKDGAALQRLCAAKSGTEDDLYCFMYISGVYSGIRRLYEGTSEPPPFCVPQTTTLEAVVEQVRRHLGGHPELQHKDPYVLFDAALKEAFPCP